LINLAILQGDFRKDYPTAIETYNEYLSVMSEAGEVVAEDDPVRGYISSIEKNSRTSGKETSARRG
jgi:hypothetical protein